MTTTLPADPKYIFSPPETTIKYAQPEASINSGDVYMCLHFPAYQNSPLPAHPLILAPLA